MEVLSIVRKKSFFSLLPFLETTLGECKKVKTVSMSGNSVIVYLFVCVCMFCGEGNCLF